jgi:hypothetical protein
MSNWDGPEDNATSGTNYLSTCRFKLNAGVSSDSSRTGAFVATDSPSNSLKINIQRAVAKVCVKEIIANVLNNAGTGTSAGSLVLGATPKWAVGNLNTSTYPFQIWEGSGSNRVVKSTRYNETTPILPKNNNSNFANKMDNSRWAGANADYLDQKLTVTGVRGTINNTSSNQLFSTSADNYYVLVTENNNAQTSTHYSTFITFGGQYLPASYITAVNNLGTPTTATGTPTWSSGGEKDTLYYVSTFGNGLFFHGSTALAEYVKYALQIGDGTATPPKSDATTMAYINTLRVKPNGGQAPMQSYYQGNCFYRVWIKDNVAVSAANKLLVRRNHAYQISITKIKGPGIADPNDIIPDPFHPVPIEEADTYVTATVEIMKWHVITQSEEIDFN